MLDTNKLEQVVEQQIKDNVRQKVEEITSDAQWITGLEQQIVEFVQARVLAKFNNVGARPDIVSAVQTSVVDLFQQGAVPGIDNYVDQKLINQGINSAVDQMITASIDNLVADPEWIKRVETLILQNYTQKLSRHLSTVDINSLVIDYIDQSVDRWQERFKKNFKTAGIIDASTTQQMLIEDDQVSISNQLVTKDAVVNDSLVVNNLAVKGSINVDNQSWNELATVAANKALSGLTEDWINLLVKQVVELSATQGIDFKSVSINGKPLVDENKLNDAITKTNIQTTGILEKLNVAGTASIHDTLLVTNKRVGINTQSPEMALSVWDEETNLLAGKVSKDKLFIGSGRKQTLAMGVNRTSHIEIDPEGLVTINQLRLGRWKISHASDVPGYSGTRGDLVLNSDPKPNSPFAWVCLGGLQWQAIRGA